METIQTDCCIVGGGPAGAMAALLLARAGVNVILLEKHKDFLRDFRGDTIHPSTLEILEQLGLLDKFLETVPHRKISKVNFGQVGGPEVNFSELSEKTGFICMVPQWDFLNFIVEEASKFPTFTLHLSACADALLKNDEGKIIGVEVTLSKQKRVAITSSIVIAADGRHSNIRKLSGLTVEELAAPIDILWFRVSRKESDPQGLNAGTGTRTLSITIDRGDYWQCAWAIAKGADSDFRAKGVEEFQKMLAETVPWLADRVQEIDDMEKVKLLTVAVNRLQTWYQEGLICIGDAAHAMSPSLPSFIFRWFSIFLIISFTLVMGVGVNLAIQDAVCTANTLAESLLQKQPISTDLLEQIQNRRLLPTKVVQAIQVQIQNRGISAKLESQSFSWTAKVAMTLLKLPYLRTLPARLVGWGIRREEVKTKNAFAIDD